MNKRDDFLVEILTEELPPKALLTLAKAFCQQIKERLQKIDLAFDDVMFFATPRRLAVCVQQLASATPDQLVDRKGPALNAAFDASGKPTPACVGFAKSCGVTPDVLQTMKNAQGEWVSFKQKMSGKTVAELLPDIIEQAAMTIPIPKRMRWGDGDAQFVRPVQGVVMLYGDHIIDTMILGCKTGRITHGHRFHAPSAITLSSPSNYASLLETKGYVIADFMKRRDQIVKQLDAIAASKKIHFIVDEALLDEVTGLVEWPCALFGNFDASFLEIPREALISSMQDHQRYFPVVDSANKLLPHFVTISNIDSKDPARVVHGNERVLRARLADAAFFYAEDKKESLEKRLSRLKDIVFQAKLGTLYDKAERISQLAEYIANKMKINAAHAARAGWLAKADLTTNMVNEFPELQGVMGGYYAEQDGEPTDVALAIKEQYMPRFAGDVLPQTPLGQALSLADRIDTLVGTFGIHHLPTGDKDPYGLRRAALGVLRILIENKINLDLGDVLVFAANSYANLENADVVPQVLTFIQERLRAWYQDQGVTPDVFASVATLQIMNPLDVHARVKAVQAFKKLSEAEALSVANKRVSNILSKYTEAMAAKSINPDYFEHAAEGELARQLDTKSQAIAKLCESGRYDQVLLQLAELRKPVDDFFDQVMVMTDDKPRRENRLLLLIKLRALFLQVADIALLQ